MADTPLITSRQNRRIVEVRKLAEHKNRQRSGCFLVEGVKLLAMGFAGRCVTISVLLSETGRAGCNPHRARSASRRG